MQHLYKPKQFLVKRSNRGPPEIEKRYDDGEAFTKQEFISYYGFHSGLQRWKDAKEVPRY